jgi:hypothetical protein
MGDVKNTKLHTHVHCPLVEKEGKGSNNLNHRGKGPKIRKQRGKKEQSLRRKVLTY